MTTINPFTGQPNEPNPFTRAPVHAGTPPRTGTSETSDRPGGTASVSSGEQAAAPTGLGLGEEGVGDLYRRAKEIKAQQAELAAEFAEIRDKLWAAVGRKLGKIPGGGSFRKLNQRRSTDFKILAEQYPEAYEAAVTVTLPDPDAPGALYL